MHLVFPVKDHNSIYSQKTFNGNLYWKSIFLSARKIWIIKLRNCRWTVHLGNVVLRNCPFGELSFGELSVGELSVWEKSLGKRPSGNWPDNTSWSSERMGKSHWPSRISNLYIFLCRGISYFTKWPNIFWDSWPWITEAFLGWSSQLFWEVILFSLEKMQPVHIQTHSFKSSD